jgi:hypothetical protein
MKQKPHYIRGTLIVGDFIKIRVAVQAKRLKSKVALMNGDQLINLLIENDILVRRTGYDLIELGEEE